MGPAFTFTSPGEGFYGRHLSEKECGEGGGGGGWRETATR